MRSRGSEHEHVTGTAPADDRAIARWRLANQHLTGPGLPSAAAVVDHLLAVQAENHGQAAWAVAARTTGTTQAAFAAAYDAGEILRTHVIRPTWHFVTRDDIGWLLALTGPRIWRTAERALERDFGIDLATVERGTQVVVDAIASDGPLVREELAARLAAEGLASSGIPLAGQLAHAELHGLVASGPQRAGAHTWALLDDRAPHRRTLDRDEALAELARRYLASHGPATERDLAYWATLTLADARAGIAAVADDLDTFTHDGRTFHVAAPPPEHDAPAEPRGHLLQLLDECWRGYQDSRHALDADGIVPSGRATALGMALADGQVVADFRSTLGPDTATFELGAFRRLSADEVAVLEQAAADQARYLELAPEIEWRDR